MNNKFKASTHTNPNSLAGAIVSTLNDYDTVEVSGIGAGAINQICKSIAIARGYTAPSGRSLVCIPTFCEVIVDELERTGMRFIIKVER